MAASLLDKFQYVGNEGTLTSLQSPGKALAASSITIGSGSNWPSASGFVLAIRTVDSSGVEIANTYTEWLATYSGSGTSVTINPVPVAGSDQVYTAGTSTQVFIPVSAKRNNLMVDGLLAQHNQDGTHGAVTATSLATTGAVTAGNGLTVSAGTVNVPSGSLSAVGLTTPYKFSVYRSTSQVGYMVTSGTYYTTQFDTALYDTGSNYNTSTYTFTAPVAGFYFLSARVCAQNSTNAMFYNIRLIKNGVTASPLDFNQGNTATTQGSPGIYAGGQVYQLAASDTVIVQTSCGVNNIGINGGANTTWFSGRLVSTT